MGTNYYWLDGTHIAKTSAVGKGKFKVFWAQSPNLIRRARVSAMRLYVIDEYGHEMPLSAFLDHVDQAVENDLSTIGQEFS